MKLKSNCKNCEKEFLYFPSQSKGKFCSNTCQGEFINKEKVLSGKATFESARTYALKHWEYECSECKIIEWNNQKLCLQLDHKNGNKKDNSLPNLRWLCPNCHSQTPTWGVKNVSEEGRKRLSTSKKNKK